ncbi:MAG: DNA-binding protein [Candidatus Omnitrophica bacterium]|nr:DNA-binding protein [Candidatus Omnitrophota bacterium]
MMEKSNIKNQISKLRIKNQNHINNFDFRFVILVFAFCILSFSCFAEPVSSSDLINNAKQYDGKEITYKGEVIGDIMARGKFAWINVNDTKNAIGVWAASELVKGISTTGSYTANGDIVEVKGKFNRACIEHGGDLDIHAESLVIVQKGEKREEIISHRKIITAIAFLIICLTLTIIYFIRLGYGR